MPPPLMSERLQKYLARAEIGSRRYCEELIKNGRVRINSEVVNLGAKVQPGDVIYLDEKEIKLGSVNKVYYMLNKPKRVLCANKDARNRVLVTELVPKSPKVFHVGRLDYMSEGLLFLTNDGSFAQKIIHPSSKIEKEYVVTLNKALNLSDYKKIKSGLMLEDGFVLPRKLKSVSGDVVILSIIEGRNRLVRRIFESLDYSVIRLLRTRIGLVLLGNLKPGEFRSLKCEEINWFLNTEN